MALAQDAQNLFAQGYELYKGGLYKGAIALFEQGLASEPNNGLAHFYLAECHYKQGSLAPALEHYRQAAALLPEGDDKTRSRNLALAIEAELDAGGATADTGDSSSTVEPTTTTASAPLDWPSLVGQDAGVSRAIMDFYNTTHPVDYVPRSVIKGVYEMKLESATPTGAVVAFRCLVANPGEQGKFFRARATLSADGTSFKVVQFEPREKFNLQKVGVF